MSISGSFPACGNFDPLESCILFFLYIFFLNSAHHHLCIFQRPDFQEKPPKTSTAQAAIEGVRVPILKYFKDNFAAAAA